VPASLLLATGVATIAGIQARDGWVYCAAVIDAHSRRIVGWSISDRITAEIVVDALEMARWRRRPEPGTVVHADRGAQYTSWLFGHRLRQAGLLGSMGRVASSVDCQSVSAASRKDEEVLAGAF
ncbi:DDE-type integrase/transposase/recombinase, partial [Microbacterium sp. MRS-1]|uniref:DDE-type integrase/transposase/recombinase n=1 Tax=Microbacterium sp. MRS-1 TaxID=1451261 RepID=UPI001E51F10B